MRRFKLMAAVAVVLAVGAAAMLATNGRAKAKDETATALFTTLPLITNGQPGLHKLTNLGDKPITYTVGAADVTGNVIPGSGGTTTCPSLGTCDTTLNFGANQEAISFACIPEEDALTEQQAAYLSRLGPDAYYQANGTKKALDAWCRQHR